MFRFIIEYSSLRDFGPYIIELFLYEDFLKKIFWLVLKLKISYRVYDIWKDFGDVCKWLRCFSPEDLDHSFQVGDLVIWPMTITLVQSSCKNLLLLLSWQLWGVVWSKSPENLAILFSSHGIGETLGFSNNQSLNNCIKCYMMALWW